MSKNIKVAIAAILMTILCSGAAYGQEVENIVVGTPASETLTGTNRADNIDATQGGSDIIEAKDGKDTIFVNDGVADDTVKCGAGTDKVTADVGDTLNSNCENKTRVPIPPACSGVPVSPSQNLVTVANANPSGTTFCVADGTYIVSQPVPVDTGDVWTGVYSDGTQPVVKSDATSITYDNVNGAVVTGESQVPNIFELGNSNDVTIQGIAVTGAAIPSSCVKPDCGRGFAHGGTNITFDTVKSYINENAGIGNPGTGAVVKNSQLTQNGNTESTTVGEPVSAAGIKSGHDFSIIDSDLSGNFWIGSWCDTDCEVMKIDNSVLSNNGKAGVSYEIAGGLGSYVKGSTIKNNGLASYVSSTRHGGVLIVGSERMEVSGNTFGGNSTDAVIAADDLRGGAGHNLVDIQIVNNILNGDTINSCSRAGVTCLNNS